MKINGRDVHFAYTIGAKCDFEDWYVMHENSSVSTAIVERALIMNRAWINANNPKEKPLTREELRNLPANEFDALAAALDVQEKKDSRQTVEAEPEKGTEKNAKSADR